MAADAAIYTTIRVCVAAIDGGHQHAALVRYRRMVEELEEELLGSDVREEASTA